MRAAGTVERGMLVRCRYAPNRTPAPLTLNRKKRIENRLTLRYPVGKDELLDRRIKFSPAILRRRTAEVDYG